MTNVGKDLEKRKPLYSVDDIVNWCSTKENSMEFLKTKNRTIRCSSNFTPEYISKKYLKTLAQKNTCTLIFLEAFFFYNSQDV